MIQNVIPTSLKKLGDFRDRVPGHRKNGRVHLSTLGRWCSTGVQLPDGARLRLRAVRIGRSWLTTDEWFTAFVEALTAAYDPAPTTDFGPQSEQEVRHGC